MTEPYKALRVPIPLLHQKVYPTGQRLPKWEGVVFNAKGAVVTFNAKATSVSATSSSCGTARCATSFAGAESVFERTPYLRRFFILVDGKERTICRLCGQVAVNSKERSEHVGCYKPLSLTLKKLVKSGACIVCGGTIDKVKVDQDFNDIPVCDDICMETWETFNPDVFEFETGVTQEELEKEVLARVANSEKNVKKYFGDPY